MRDFTEEWLKAAVEWCDADSAARLLEETRSSVLSKWIGELGDIPVSRAEATVKGSERWHDYVTKTVAARTRAERLKIAMKYAEMKRFDQISKDATSRTEARL